MKRISVIFGTRPEAIKLAPVIRELRSRDGIAVHVCVTAQHREMLDQALEVFGLVPDVDLQLMRPAQALAELTARALTTLDAYLAEHAPDLVVVQGDTTTTLAASLAAFYRRVPIAHVEAGLRTHDLAAPFPEEANRVITSRLAHWHFAPTARARDALVGEGVDPARVFLTGNTVVDALRYAVGVARERVPVIPGLAAELMTPRHRTRLVLITGHRRESFGAGFESICQAIAELADRFPDVVFAYPVHLNPNVQKPVRRVLGNRDNVVLLDPLPYLPFVRLMDRATLILTDSGGIQEEAPSLGKPVLVLRESTERPEAVEAGVAELVGTDRRRIVSAASRLLAPAREGQTASRRDNPFGDGHAASRIADLCAAALLGSRHEVACGVSKR